MKFWMLGFSLLFSVSAQAEMAARILISPEMRFERGEEQEVESRSALGLAAGVSVASTIFLFEYAQFSTRSGSGSLEIDRTHRDFLLWLQRSVWHGKSFLSPEFYLAGAVGGFDEKIETSLSGGDSVVDHSAMKLQGAVAVGFEGRVNMGAFSALLLALEGRMYISGELQPNPQFAALLRLGIELGL